MNHLHQARVCTRPTRQTGNVNKVWFCRVCVVGRVPTFAC